MLKVHFKCEPQTFTSLPLPFKLTNFVFKAIPGNQDSPIFLRISPNPFTDPEFIREHLDCADEIPFIPVTLLDSEF
ncbi:hypothetical protein [Levilactobacillus mulengensis]|mgnify:CR=1 FL=1|uniref:hypothetical protein n=1 Tax=Levilactobacillus mulengensis TaxID=2486025 RepID=UPI000F7A9B66|nr:hypothetical protein [Levilactobacillus mulengensis]